MSHVQRKDDPSTCPKKLSANRRSHKWLRFIFPVTGLLALIWFMVRVIPKPSRATYPCQRVAFPLASSFVIWLMGLIGSVVAFRRAKKYMSKARYAVAAICVATSVAFIYAAMSSTDQKIIYGHEPRASNPAVLSGFTTPMPRIGPAPARENAGIQAPALISRPSIKCSPGHLGHWPAKTAIMTPGTQYSETSISEWEKVMSATRPAKKSALKLI